MTKKIILIIAFAVLLVMFMNSRTDEYKLAPFTDLSGVNDTELADLDWKKAETEGVKLEANYPKLTAGNDVGILIIHGFTGSPLEMQPAADFLTELGYTVYQARLAGHGSVPENLNATTYQDWYESVRYGWFLLKRNCRKVFIMGESMGGLVALTTAGLNGADGVILLSPCIKMRSSATAFSPFLSRFIKTLPKIEVGDWSKDQHDIFYDRWPVRGIYQLLMFTRYAEANMDRFTFPMIGFQFANDMVVSGRATKEFFDKAPSGDKTYVEFPDKKMMNHILVSELNIYRSDMFTNIAEWLNERGR